MRRLSTLGFSAAALCVLLSLATTPLFAQADWVFNPDSFCLELGEHSSQSVFDNDILPDGVTVMLEGQWNCFNLDFNTGAVVWAETADEGCCGVHESFYMVLYEGQFIGGAWITLEIKCPKPDCSLIDLHELIGEASPDGAGEGGAAPCINVCEFSQVTYFFTYNPLYTYNWTLPEPFVQGSNTASIVVDYGPAGSSYITLEVIDNAGVSTTYTFCVNILNGPQANFTSTAYACLNTPMTFENLFPGAASYTWDFGDGTVVNNDGQFVQHNYTNPGVYTVKLTATSPVFGSNGSPLCCCTAEYELDVEVDELEGPQIFCLSTLCEGDEATYSTNAANCASYTWTVVDANGNPVAFTGQNTSEIVVQWGAGPFGMVTLEALGCDDEYCPAPTTVTIPIVSATSDVNGPVVVCAGSTHTYTIPKWPGTTYTWNVSGGTVVGGGTGHTVDIQWGFGSIGTIEVLYESTFLSGLTGAAPGSCSGVANLTVEIRSEFELYPSATKVCPGEFIIVNYTQLPSNNYSWTITPSASGAILNQFGNYVEIIWDTAPGVYTVTAVPNDPVAYCNGSQSFNVQVMNVQPPAAINGPIEVCGNEIAFYSAQASQSGVNLVWTVSGGTLSSNTGSTVQVTWSGAPPYYVTVAQQLSSAPGCLSPADTLFVTRKSLAGPLQIAGTANCVNTNANYQLNPVQHPDAVVDWEISPASAGTVIAGQGTPNPTIQWNNQTGFANIVANVTLCGVTMTTVRIVNLVAQPQPIIIQNGYICPGGSGVLETTQPFASYLWNDGSTNPTLSVSEGGWYNVTVENPAGCQGTGYFEAIESPAPIADISTSDPVGFCIQSPIIINIVAQTNPNYIFEWFQDGVSQMGPSPNSIFARPPVGVPGTYFITVQVTDIVTGCTAVSDPLEIFESSCLTGQGCVPEPYTLSPTAVAQVPDCNSVQFTANGSPNVIVSRWGFDDGNQSTATSPTHVYDEAGCYGVMLEVLVPNTSGSGFCVVYQLVPICVPLVARFDHVQVNCRTYNFSSTSTFLDPPNGTAITSYDWNFGSGTASGPNVNFTFPSAGTFPVTLTVTNASGCTTSRTVNVEVGGVGVPTITASTTTACVSEAILFTGSALNAVSYTWDFNGEATFIGPISAYAFTTPGTKTVTVTAQDQAGCTETASYTVEVNPGVPNANISGLSFHCEGGSVTISALAGYDYLWSTGETTQSINATAGVYTVTMINAFGCQRTIGPKTITEIPAPPATINGAAYICDSGCETLTAPFDPGYTYQWFDGGGNQLPSFTGNTAQACAGDPLPATFTVQVTDQNGCSATSAPFTVDLAVSPSLTLTNSGSGCEGSLNVLEVAPNDPNIGYLWSTGASGTTITVAAAGTYSVTGTDLTTGCKSTVSTVVNPLPDLCSVPYGCYEQCDSITVCVAPGLGNYQWNLGGIPLPGANSNCLFIDQSGSYTLTVTTPDGCSDTSAVLEITIIPCGDCEDIQLTWTLATNDNGEEDPCCATVSYDIAAIDVYSVQITSPDAGVGLVTGSVSPALGVQSNTPAEVRLSNANPLQPLPQGALNDFATLCALDPVNSPQTFYFEWLNQNNEVVCVDSLTLHCPVEPPCLYLLEDHVVCEGGSTFYTFTVCNPHAQSWSVGFIELVASSPPGIGILPASIDLTSAPIAPGSCQTFTVELTGAAIGGQTFCYSLIGHAEDPAVNPAAVCCSLEDQVCIELPQCDPCDDVWVEAVTTGDHADCCYSVTLFNDFDAAFFDEIKIIANSALTSFTINNPTSSGWLVQGYTGTEASFMPGAPFGGFAPLGAFTLPDICVVTNGPYIQSFTVQWMQNGVVVCEEEFHTDCEPPCGYFFEDTIDCDLVTGQYIFSGYIKNTADYTVGVAEISFASSSGLNVWNTSIALGSLAPGGIFGPVSFPIGAPAQAGDVICFTVTLHEVNADGIFLNCCNFTHCIELPDCDFNAPCVCDEAFYDAVAQGFTYIQQGFTVDFALAAAGFFNDDCDQIRWSVQGVGSSGVINPSAGYSLDFPAPGNYSVLFRINRVDENGMPCTGTFTGAVSIGSGLYVEPNIYPNPNNGQFKVLLDNPDLLSVEVSVHDATGRPLLLERVSQVMPLTEIMVDLGSSTAHGMYIVLIRMGEQVHTAKIMISN